jgi:putative flippase GtrA
MTKSESQTDGAGTPQLHNRKIRFLIAGVSTASLYFVSVFGLITVGLASWAAALIAYGFSFIIGYAVQKYFAFQSKSNHSESLPRYGLLQLCCAGFAAVSASAVDEIGYGNPLAVAIVTTGILGIVSFIASSKWVFSK